jgi:hypothetical protein
MLLQQCGATCCWFPLWVRFATFKSANISETVEAGWDVSKEHEYETEIDPSIGQVDSARWQYLPTVPANDLFSRLLKALITRKRQEPFIDFSSKTAKIIVKKLNQFLTVCKGHHNIG